MSNLKRIWRSFIWEKIKIAREGYFLVYTPINRFTENYASLDLVFVSEIEIEKIAKIMEEELKNWSDKYAVPTIVFAYDKSEDEVELINIRNGNLLLGYLDKDSRRLIQIWGSLKEVLNSEALVYIDDKELVKIYNGLSYKTINEKEKESHKKINEKRKIKKFIDGYFYIWLLISILIPVLGLKSYIVGVASFLYSIYMTYRKAKCFKGYKSKKQKDDDEVRRKKEHYYYHCEKNSVGFLRLKQENFKTMSQERVILEDIEIRNKDY